MHNSDFEIQTQTHLSRFTCLKRFAVSMCFSVSLVKVQQVGSQENRVLIHWSQTTLSTHKSHCRLLKYYNRNALPHELV